jgi:hypothetical protein
LPPPGSHLPDQETESRWYSPAAFFIEPPGTSSVTIPRFPFEWWLSAHGMAEQRVNVRSGFVRAAGDRDRNDGEDKM